MVIHLYAYGYIGTVLSEIEGDGHLSGGRVGMVDINGKEINGRLHRPTQNIYTGDGQMER